mgnify:CR=1 FL=1
MAGSKAPGKGNIFPKRSSTVENRCFKPRHSPGNWNPTRDHRTAKPGNLPIPGMPGPWFYF